MLTKIRTYLESDASNAHIMGILHSSDGAGLITERIDMMHTVAEVMMVALQCAVSGEFKVVAPHTPKKGQTKVGYTTICTAMTAEALAIEYEDYDRNHAKKLTPAKQFFGYDCDECDAQWATDTVCDGE